MLGRKGEDGSRMELRKVTFHRFKQFADQEIPISGYPVTLLAGGNNSGKSSVLHGLAVWEFCRTVLLAERGPEVFDKAVVGQGRQGMGLGDEEFSPIAVPSLNHLWTNLRSQKQGEPDGYTLSIHLAWTDDGVDRHLEFALSLANDRLFLRVNDSNLGSGDRVPQVAYLPPFAGITDREMRLPGAIRRRRIGEGLAGAVLRNLLLDMQVANATRRQELRGERPKIRDVDLRTLRQSDPWELLQAALRRTFGAELVMADFNEEYHSYIRAEVVKGEVDGFRLKRHSGYNKRDVMVEGSGFLQWLSVYTLAASPEVDVLLLDEPDAHLHVSLQRELFAELTRLAEATDKQVLVATHSAEIIRDAPARSILQFRRDKPRFLQHDHQKVGLLAGLGSDYAPRLDRIRQTRKVLFVEGSSDEDILATFATTLGIDFPSDWVVWRWASGHKERRQLYLALVEEFGEIDAISLVDRDTTPVKNVGDELEDKGFGDSDGFRCLMWRRRNIESYLLWPPAIAKAAGLDVDDVIDQLRDRCALAVPDTFPDRDVPLPLMDADGKAILKTGDDAILGQLEVDRLDVARAFEASEICTDISIVLNRLGPAAPE